MTYAPLLAKLVTSFAGILTAALAGSAQAGFVPSPPSFEESGLRCTTAVAGRVCPALFDSSQPLWPGGPAQSRSLTLTYLGSKPSSAAGLYLAHYGFWAASSGPLCSAADPGAGFDFAVSANGMTLYRGTLADFAANHSDPASRLALPGRAGQPDRWSPGDSETVTLSVALDRAAGNQFMTCSATTDFVWYAAY